MVSQNTQIAEFLSELFKQNYNFSSQKSRSDALTNYCKKYKIIDKKKVRSAFYPALNKMLEESGIPPQTFGLKKTKPLSVNSDLIPHIHPEPVPDTTKPKGNAGMISNTGQASEITQPRLSPDGRLLTDEMYVITTRHVGAFFAALYLVLKLKWKFLEDLSEEDKTALAEMWLPAFQRYLSDKMKLIVLPVIGTIGLMAPKIQKAKQLAKKEKPDEKIPDKKVDEKLSKYVQGVVCAKCRGLFPASVIQEHSLHCKVNPS